MSRCLSLLASLALVGMAVTSRAEAPVGIEFFEKEVRPLLLERCGSCHGEKGKSKGGLRLDSREAILKGGDSGPAAVPGKPDESLIVEAIRYVDEPKMPPKGKLNDREVDTLTRWIAMGLPWPAQGENQSGGAVKTASSGFSITENQRKFWAFQPLNDDPPPAVNETAWVRSAIDRYVLAGLESKKLKHAPPADRRMLIRRATFDLTGLPPTPEEVDAFLADSSPEAFARVVDRLLASPRYGERWARHWLDIVRYTDSFDARGLGGEGDCAEAWRYRDWVIDAFNRDLPYDQFVTDQIAGDLIPPKEKGGLNTEALVATGMLAIGNWGGGDADKEKLLTDIADDQVDVVSRAFLGLTIACARCHDHKFDPISTKDYYGLAGIFFSTHILPNVGPKTNGPPMMRIPLVSPNQKAQRERHAERLADLDAQIKTRLDEEKAALARRMLPETSRYMLAAWDYAAGDPSRPLGDFAASRGLQEHALRQWGTFLGLLSDYQSLKVPVRDVLGAPGIHGWKGGPEEASVTVNTTRAEVTILTFKLPPRSVAVHPGPRSGAVVAWRSPIAGTVQISGRIADADPAGGDGVAWTVGHRRGRVTRTIASGMFENGGAQPIGGPAMESLEVKVGDLGTGGQ